MGPNHSIVGNSDILMFCVCNLRPKFIVSAKLPKVLRKHVMLLIRLFSLLLISCFLKSMAGAHGGGIERFGGRNSQTVDNYHFQKSLLAERPYGSKFESIIALKHAKNNDLEQIPSEGTNPPEITQFDEETVFGIHIAPEVRITPLERRDYAYPQSIELSIIARQGGIFSPYTLRFLPDMGETDIEHIVAVSEAHESGLSSRSDSERKAFGQDLDNLTLAEPHLNRHQKAGKDPSEWLPENNQCWYVAKYIEIKKKYGLTMDAAEAAAVFKVYESCESFEMTMKDRN